MKRSNLPRSVLVAAALVPLVLLLAWVALRAGPLAPVEVTVAEVRSAELTPAQLEYAASDVLYLHAVKARLDEMLEREGQIVEEAIHQIGGLPCNLALREAFERDQFHAAS